MVGCGCRQPNAWQPTGRCSQVLQLVVPILCCDRMATRSTACNDTNTPDVSRKAPGTASVLSSHMTLCAQPMVQCKAHTEPFGINAIEEHASSRLTLPMPSACSSSLGRHCDNIAFGKCIDCQSLPASTVFTSTVPAAAVHAHKPW